MDGREGRIITAFYVRGNARNSPLQRNIPLAAGLKASHQFSEELFFTEFSPYLSEYAATRAQLVYGSRIPSRNTRVATSALLQWPQYATLFFLALRPARLSGIHVAYSAAGAYIRGKGALMYQRRRGS